MPISSGHRRANDGRAVAMLSAAPGRQRGVALILVLMLVVTASAFVILQALNNRSSHETAQRLATVAALGQARRALIGYAVDYADGEHAGSKGPGRLPCPDRAGGELQGIAEGASSDCRVSSSEETGLLPFRTLGLTALTDGSGAPLWYAVSNNFRSLATNVINSETKGSFTVDDSDDVVAVIIAPGPPLAGQVRNSATTYTAGAWLEGENATPGDNRFTRINDASNNDTVMVITRSDLMVEVEKVVTKEVDNALLSYHHDPDGDDDAAGVDPDCGTAHPDCDDGLPWLAPLLAPTYAGAAGVGTAGLAHLPILKTGTAFDVDFTAMWSLGSSGTATFSGAEPPDESCLRSHACSQDFRNNPPAGGPSKVFFTVVQGASSASWKQGVCVLTRDEKAPYPLGLDCSNSYTFTVPGRSLRRTYRIKLSGNTRIIAPTATAPRMVEVRALGSWMAGTSGSITVTDKDGANTIGSAQLDFTSLTTGEFMALLNVPFDLEVWPESIPLDRHLSPGALPNWLYADEWYKSLLLRYAPSEAPGYAGPNCVAAGSCLTLRMQHPGDALATDVAGVRGVVVAAGPPLPAIASPAKPAQVRPSSNLSDYLEGINNSNATSIYERRDPSSSFNDQILPLSP